MRAGAKPGRDSREWGQLDFLWCRRMSRFRGRTLPGKLGYRGRTQNSVTAISTVCGGRRGPTLSGAALASSRGTVSAYFGADKLAAENRIAGFGAHGCRGPPPHAMPLGFEAWNGRPHHRSVNLASPMSRGTGLADEGWSCWSRAAAGGKGNIWSAYRPRQNAKARLESDTYPSRAR
jgi:hypothetical protein